MDIVGALINLAATVAKWFLDLIVSLIVAVYNFYMDVFCFITDAIVGAFFDQLIAVMPDFGFDPQAFWAMMPDAALRAISVLWIDKAFAIYLTAFAWRYKWSLLMLLRR